MRIKFKLPLLIHFMRLQRASETYGALLPFTKVIDFVMAISKLFFVFKIGALVLFLR
jgi:hypothetical protein